MKNNTIARGVGAITPSRMLASRLLAPFRSAARAMMGDEPGAFAHKLLPLLLLGGLLLGGLVTICAQTGNYGISYDEPLQEGFGRHVLAWYGTFGKETSFLTAFPPETHMPEHGGVFDAFIAAVQFLLPHADPWFIRHFITALSGLLGVVAIALCGYELGGYWVAFLAGLGLWLYPRFYGAIYNNPKDIPAAVSMTFVLWVTLLLVKHWSHTGRSVRYGVLLGFFIGLAAAIRVNAVIWYAILLIPLAIWWLLHGKQTWREGEMRTELGKQGLVAGAIGVTSLLSMMALWPYILLNPIHNLYNAIVVLSHYPWNGSVLYEGRLYLATQLPGDYTPTWLFIASPPALIALFLLGLGVAGAALAKTRRIDPRVGLVALALIVPLVTLIATHAVVYDGLRQFLFLVPPMILLAAYGLAWAIGYLARERRAALRWAAVGLVLATVVSYAFVVKDMLDLTPYEYAYFSPVIGGLPGAAGQFETDYWSTCSKQSAEWLAQNYRRYTGAPASTVASSADPLLTSPFLPPTFRNENTNPDFFISYTRDGADQQFPTYPVIHVVAAEGVPLCVVKANPSLGAR